MTEAINRTRGSQRSPVEGSRSWLTSGIQALWRVFIIALGTLVFSIVVEWVGMAFFWPEAGVQHSAAMIDAEVSYLNFIGRSENVVAQSVDGAFQSVMAGVRWAIEVSQVQALANSSIEVLRLGVVSAINIIYVFVLRLTVLVLSLPTFLVFGIVGLSRGMMRRELRRWGGGRESSGMFHLYSNLLPASVIGVWVLYLSSPVSINPFLIIGPAAMLFAATLSGLSYRFKKYV